MTRPGRSIDRLAFAVVALSALTILVVTLVGHRTPLLGVETDLLGDTVPAARAIARGEITPESFLFRGPGYPGMLAAASLVAGGDEYLAARLLNVLAFAAAAAAVYLTFRPFLGPPVALAVLTGLVTSPVIVRAAIEAGSDMPAMALASLATWLALGRQGPRARAVAGAIAGLAYATRYNTAFLVPAVLLGLAGRRAPVRDLVLYLAGFALVVGGWLLAQFALTGALPRNQNFLNVAYEVYGGGMGWDAFWLQAGDVFRSFADVVGHDPARFLAHVGRNVATRWVTDLQQLVPVAWVGVLAPPGLALTWWRRPGARPVLLHGLFAYLVLSVVFYAPRFFIYLIPFYLSGTFGLLLRDRLDPPAPGLRVLPRWTGLVGTLVAGLLLALSALASVRETRRMLADPPDELRVGGERLRALGRPGERVLARKPHAPYFAGMTYVPIPYADAYTEFLAAARRSRADYLFISPAETGMHPQLSVLMDPDVTLPGLVPIAYGTPRPSRYFAIYRLVETDLSPVAIDDSLLGAIRRFAARRPGAAWPRTYLGGHLTTMGRFEEALAPLAEAQRLDPADPLVARFQAQANAELGRLDEAAAACERALALQPEASRDRGFLGQVRLAQGRYGEARDALRRAMSDDPANPRYPVLLLRACALGGLWAEAAPLAEQVVRRSPEDASARLLGARAWLQLARPDRARALLESPGTPSGPDAAAAAALADSLRRAPARGRP